MKTAISVRLIAILVAALSLLISCSEHQEGRMASGNFQGTPACKNNSYLKKFGCSVARIQTAANQGDRDAQYALGYIYFYGVGTERNAESARYWIRKAAAQGQPLALKASHILHYQSGPTPEIRAKYARHDNKTVDEMNTAMPNKQINKHLPRYKKHKTGTARKAPPVLDVLKRKEHINSSHYRPTHHPLARTIHVSSTGDQMRSAQGQYTLQLMSGTNLHSLQTFVREHGLQHQAHIYRLHYHHRNWYLLTLGKYRSITEARHALRHLPVAVQALHPWIKSVKVLKREIKAGRLNA